jgi:hypothetical protein
MYIAPVSTLRWAGQMTKKSTKCYLTNVQKAILCATRNRREPFTVADLSELLNGSYTPKVLYDSLSRNLGDDKDSLFVSSPLKAKDSRRYAEGYELTDYGRAWAAWLQLPANDKIQFLKSSSNIGSIQPSPTPTEFEIRNNEDFVSACTQALGNIGERDLVLVVARRFWSLIHHPEMKRNLEIAISSRKASMDIYITEEADKEKVVEYLRDLCSRNRNTALDNEVRLWQISADDYTKQIGQTKRYVFVRDKAEVRVDGERSGERFGRGFLGGSPDFSRIQDKLEEIPKLSLIGPPSRNVTNKGTRDVPKSS